MKRLIAMVASAGVAVSLTLVGVAAPVWAGGGSVGGTTVSWDDASMYVPTGCSSFLFNYTNDPSVNFGHIDILNAYGDKLGVQTLSGASGTAPIQVCAINSFVGPYTLRLESHARSAYGGAINVVDLPFAFIPRAPAATSTPAPAPVATPAPPNTAAQRVRCINKKTFKKKWFKNVSKCPKGWVKI